MNKSILFAASLLALNLTPGFGQPNGSATLPQQRLLSIINSANAPQDQLPALTKFNLDFPGGTPKELVAAIEKAMGKPINVIIPDEDAATKLPPLKLNEVTFSQLSDTLRVGSTKTEYILVRNGGGGGSSQGVETGYYFRTTDDRPTDNSVWFFRVTKKPEQPPQPPVEKVCQFYSLSPYLDRGFTVDDITTAIQTGWKMAGVTPTPVLNYHKETKMLIAFGEPYNLQTIQQVLQTLPATRTSRAEISDMQDQIRDLTGQVAQLKKQTSPPPPSVSPEEKPGK